MQRWVSDHWVAWNLLLALLPLLIAVGLFTRPRAAVRSRWWWMGMAAFVAFLPNSPYVVTDLIHLRVSLSESSPVVVLGKYAVLLAGGLLAYVACIALLRGWLRTTGVPAWPVEVAVHALCTVGIALGRLFRLNSWDLLLQPASVVGAIRVPTAWHALVLGCLFGFLCGTSLLVRWHGGIRAAGARTD